MATAPAPPTSTSPPAEGSGESLEARHARYEEATAGLDPPFALVDLGAMWANAADMLRRAGPKPIRVASKSVRCRPLLETILARAPSELGAAGASGFRGLMTYTLAESLWLHAHGFDDLLLAYPTADRAALGELGRLEGEGRPIVMVDSVEHLDLIERTAGGGAAPVWICIELDTSFRPAGGRIRVGSRRSPLRTADEVTRVAREVVRRPGLELAGLMAYEAHVAGFGDDPPGPRLKGAAIRRLQRASLRELAERRAEVVEAVGRVAPVRLVNGGGTGSLHVSARAAEVTEVTAGSGFYAPRIFDFYSAFALRPAAMFALPVVRRPGPEAATLLGGGYHSSGAAGAERLPQPYLPAGLRLDPREGAGEVQTPVLGPPADRLSLGDRVYLRHAKAGELCEHFDRLYLLEGAEVVDEVPTYRGEGRTFL